MRKVLVFSMIMCVFGFISQAAPANTVIAVKSGPWVQSDTWSCKCMPKRTDGIIIPQGVIVSVTHTLRLAPSEDGKPLVISVAGTLSITEASVFLDPIDRIIVLPGGRINSRSQGGAVFSGIYGVSLGGTYLRGPAILGDNFSSTAISAILAEKEPKGVNLSWRSSPEIDVNYYYILRSADGIKFETIGKVDGRGSRKEKVFQFIDESRQPGLSYYRVDLATTNGVDLSAGMIPVKVESDNGNVVIVPAPSSAGN